MAIGSVFAQDAAAKAAMAGFAKMGAVKGTVAAVATPVIAGAGVVAVLAAPLVVAGGLAYVLSEAKKAREAAK